MRTKHAAHSFPAFPVYSAAFVGYNELVLGGGGGATRSGIKNKLRLYRVENEKSMELLDEYELGKDEDVPMSMAAHPKTKAIVSGINSANERMLRGENENCRMFSVKDKKFNLESAKGTIPPGDAEDYQRATSFSEDGNFVAVAGQHDLSVLSYPSMSRAAKDIHVGDDEIYDVSFSKTSLVLTTTKALSIYDIPENLSVTEETKKGKQKEVPLPELSVAQTIKRPTLPGAESYNVSYRSARYKPGSNNLIYSAINSAPPRGKGKAPPRRAYVCMIKGNGSRWEVEKKRKVTDGAITAFDVSLDGRFLAYGASDLSIGLLDTTTLAPLLTILKAHELPTTALRFNPPSKLLISGSADSTVRIIEVPEFSGGGWGIFILIMVALFVLLFAVATQLYISGRL
ncbi:WD40 repeat-like protein [Neolentinus lepideus HHB14362 ss-1]|uniref:WD40 repeat-like protein n=1 Tax=Neolentinus lepideus HHB14362 ss-1 TaxID=1314782 RepID=A0A165PAQ4_9AGAM|nr:WD40 repeat-like protein [Neolentinus lepideus HHB14362 ss-1]